MSKQQEGTTMVGSGDESNVIEQQYPQEKYKGILIFGPPGSGKGTQSDFLVKVTGDVHVSTGEIFRSLSSDTQGGILYNRYAEKGRLIPDEATIHIWHEYVLSLKAAGMFDPRKQFLLLDGIPRTIHQAEMLDKYVDVVAIIALSVEDKGSLIMRMRDRAIKEGRNDDKDLSVLRERFEIYERDTKTLLSHYPSDIIHTVDAAKKPLGVFRDILVQLVDVLETSRI
jgi:adenylate kinase